MQMCPSHWEALRQGVKDRGLWHLVATSGEEAFAQVQDELAGTADPQRFDPLISANWAMFSTAIQFGGLEMLDGQHCPLCEADKHGGHAQEWIEGCLDAQLAHARDLKLAPAVQ